MTSPRDYHHSNIFISSFQAKGLCIALRMTISVGAHPGPATLKLLKSLRDNIVATGSGLTVEHLPEIAENMDSHDVLAAAEVLRTTILAFLSPEEVEEQRGALGFHAHLQPA